MSRHILVTGGAGFIGSHLVERLLAEGKSVVVIDDFSTGSRENLQGVQSNARLKIVSEKVSACAELRDLVRDSESIYHLAAAVGVELILHSGIDAIKTNLRETEAVLEVAGEFNIPFLLTSTSEVYGKSTKPAFSEEDDLVIGPPHLSRWSYACSKLMDEFLVLAYAREKKLPVVIARLFNTVGPRQTGKYGMVLPRFITAAKRGEPLKVFGDGKQTRCFCSVADAVEALVRLQNCPAARGEIFNVGGSEEISIASLARLVVGTLHSSSAIEFIPYDSAYAPGFQDMLRRKPIIEKLKTRIGFDPATSLQAIIKKTALSINKKTAPVRGAV
ncbi:MAG: NAD-dependent epimerase/dehydratase family protein [Verrucomicrobiota bacterium]